jgi:hypothetical protein
MTAPALVRTSAKARQSGGDPSAGASGHARPCHLTREPSAPSVKNPRPGPAWVAIAGRSERRASCSARNLSRAESAGFSCSGIPVALRDDRWPRPSCDIRRYASLWHVRRQSAVACRSGITCACIRTLPVVARPPVRHCSGVGHLGRQCRAGRRAGARSASALASRLQLPRCVPWWLTASECRYHAGPGRWLPPAAG